MAIQTINLGTYANDGSGDDLRTAFQKVNANFAELDAEAAISTAVNIGGGIGIFASKNGINLEFKSLTSTDNSVTFTNASQTINLKANTKLESDLNPKLGADLNLNDHIIFGGDTQTSIFGIDVKILNAILELAIESNSISLDLGSFVNPTGKKDNLPNGYVLDMGTWVFGEPPPTNNLNFGSWS